MEIISGIHLIEGLGANVYLAKEEGGPVLIDSGMPGRSQKIWDYMAGIGYQPADIQALIITHADTDHAGNAAEIQAASQAPLFASRQTARLLSQGKAPKHLPWLIQFLSDRIFRYKALPANSIETVEDGERLPYLGDMIALATPGHSLDHFSFFSPVHGILFAGDALHTRQDRLQNTQGYISADKEAARRSAERLLKLTPAVFACGHGRPMKDHSAEMLFGLLADLRS